MSEPSSPASAPRFVQGYRCDGGDPQLLARAIDAAFDYRGDVTLGLDRGEEVQGYLSNRDLRAPEPFVEVFPADGSPKRRILCREIRSILFSGRDTAAGKSWETWVKTHKKPRDSA